MQEYLFFHYYLPVFTICALYLSLLISLFSIIPKFRRNSLKIIIGICFFVITFLVVFTIWSLGVVY